MLEQKPNPIKIGCFLILLGGVQGAMGAMSWADAATRGSIWAYYSKVDTMAPWEHLSFKFSYIIPLVIGILSERI